MEKKRQNARLIEEGRRTEVYRSPEDRGRDILGQGRWPGRGRWEGRIYILYFLISNHGCIMASHLLLPLDDLKITSP